MVHPFASAPVVFHSPILVPYIVVQGLSERALCRDSDSMGVSDGHGVQECALFEEGFGLGQYMGWLEQNVQVWAQQLCGGAQAHHSQLLQQLTRLPEEPPHLFNKFLSNELCDEAILALLHADLPVDVLVRFLWKLRSLEEQRNASASSCVELFLPRLPSSAQPAFRPSWSTYLVFYIFTYPDKMPPIIHALCDHATLHQNTASLMQFFKSTAPLSPTIATAIRDACMQRSMFPELIVHLSAKLLHDELLLLPLALKPAPLSHFSSTPHNTEQFSFLMRYLLKVNSNTASHGTVNENSLSAVDELKQSMWSYVESSEHGGSVETVSALRIISCLAAIRLCICESEQQFELLAKIVCSPLEQPSSAYYKQIVSLVYCLCFLSLKRPASRTHAHTTIQRITAFLWNSQRCMDTLLSLATNFHSSSDDKIKTFILTNISPATPAQQSPQKTHSPAEHLPSYLTALTLDADLLQPLSQTFNSLIPVHELAHKILSEQEPRFSHTQEDWYVLQCIYRMLKSRLFRRHEISPTRWILSQIKKTDVNHLPPVLVKIIYQLIENTVPHPHFDFHAERLSEEDIIAALHQPTSSSTTDSHVLSLHSLLLYYVLDVNATTSLPSFPTRILAHFHIMPIFDFLHAHRSILPKLFAKLYPLMVNQLQYVFEVRFLLKEERFLDWIHGCSSGNSSRKWHSLLLSSTSQSNMKSFNSSKFSPSEVVRILESPLTDQPSTKQALESLFLHANRVDKSVLEAFVNVLPHLVDQSVAEKYLCESFKLAWERLYLLFPIELPLRTINVLQPQNAAKVSGSAVQEEEDNQHRFTHEDFFKNLLLLFAIDRRTFFNPPLLEIFLVILRSFMTASSKYVTHFHHKKAASSSATPALLDEDMKKNYILTQDSSVIQVLLELCLFEASEGVTSADSVHSLTQQIIQKKICEFIHNTFLENPNLAKLVHFQTYDPRLLPITTSLIDCIHIALDFLMELINQPSAEKHVFGIQLASFLVERYPLQHCVDIAQRAIQKVRQYGVAGSGSKSRQTRAIVSRLLPAVARFGNTFPFLLAQCTAVLQELQMNFEEDEFEKNCANGFHMMVQNALANVT